MGRRMDLGCCARGEKDRGHKTTVGHFSKVRVVPQDVDALRYAIAWACEVCGLVCDEAMVEK